MTMIKKRSAAFFLLCLAGILGSCQDHRVYERYMHVNNHKWAYQDTFNYKVKIRDTSSAYQLNIKLRNKINYPYRNIWLLIQHEAPSGKLSSMKAEFQLANKSGKWKGQGLGDMYDHRFPAKRIKLSEKGKHHFKLVHLMRRDTLRGIMDVGLQINQP